MSYRSYLEKIIQKPIQLPEIEQVYIDNFLDIYIDGTIHRMIINDTIVKYSDASWETIFIDYDSNYLEFKNDVNENSFNFLNDEDKANILGLYSVSRNNLFNVLNISTADKKVFYKEFSYTYQTHIRKIFKSLRNVKRYLNGLYTTLPAVKNEVNLYDFFIIQVIRIFYPKIYDDIWNNPWNYIPLDWSDKTYLKSPFRFGSSSNDDDKYNKIKDHLNKILDSLEDSDKEIVRELLKSIFFVEVKNALGTSRTNYSNTSTSYRKEKRITHPVSFDKYFMLKVSPLEIADGYIKSIIDSWMNIPSKKRINLIHDTIIKIQKERKLQEFIKSLQIFRAEINSELAQDIIKVIYSNIHEFSRKGSDNWNSEYNKAENLLLWLVNDNINKDSIHNVMKEIIANTNYLPFAVSVVLMCNKDRLGEAFNIKETIDQEELKNILANKLNKYFIKQNNNIFTEYPEDRDWGLMLYQWASNWMDGTDKNKDIVNNYVLSLIKDNEDIFVKFLLHQKERIDDEKRVFNIDKISKLYEVKKLKSIAEKFIKLNSISEDNKNVISDFLSLFKNNFS